MAGKFGYVTKKQDLHTIYSLWKAKTNFIPIVEFYYSFSLVISKLLRPIVSDRYDGFVVLNMKTVNKYEESETEITYFAPWGSLPVESRPGEH